jgi:parallel beta-helix repeat protein
MNRLTCHIIAAGLALSLALAARAQLTNFTTIDYPGGISTLIEGINDAGDLVGSYRDSNNIRRGFPLKNGRFTLIDVPGATLSAATDINVAGDIVGFYVDANNVDHGFLLSGDRFTTVDFPGAEKTRAFTMNAKGEIVGMYWNTSGDTMRRGFLLSGGRFTEICYPEATMTMAFGINDQGEITGRWSDVQGKVRGFRLSQGKFTSFEFPGAQATAIDLTRITNSGEIVGPYTDARGKSKGFLLSGGHYTSIDVPGSGGTTPRDINAAGHITGLYSDSRGSHGWVTTIAPPSVSQPILVDDDGADCPGASPTIQEAVRRASPGATILVCRGIYTGAVNLVGPEKNGLKLIALGRTHEVILQGDYMERDGFHLENVDNVLIRGFTVRDFGAKATTATEWGAGNLIYLENAHYNTIEHNQLVNPDRAGVMLVDSGNNVVQNNVAFADNANLATCGIEVRGAKSANNVFRLNVTYGNKLAGIMIGGAGPGNVVTDNTVVANGRFGIDVQNTSEVWVEGNRVSFSRGFWGTTPGGQQPGVGLNLANLLKATVFDNRARNNTGMDLNWDGKGDNRVEANACETSVPAGTCGR